MNNIICSMQNLKFLHNLILDNKNMKNMKID